MQIKRIQCPKCNAVLDVKNTKNEEVKQFTCPSCRTMLQVKFVPQQEPIEAKTFYAFPQKAVPDNGATQLGGNVDGATELGTPMEQQVKSSPEARLEFDGKPYFLEEGKNIVGRKGNTSKATIQIPTDDRYMSRQHCAITVTVLQDGSMKAILSNYQNKNLTAVDGQTVETGDEIRLTNGNRITMGHTTVLFKV